MQTKTMQTQSIQSSGGMEKELKSLKPAQPIFIVVGLVLVVFAFCLPFLLPGGRLGNYYMTELLRTTVFCFATLGLTVGMGYAGQISLAQAAFFGLGAYSLASTTVLFGLPYWAGVVLALVIPVVTGLFLGAISLRLVTHYLALVTIGFQIIIQLVLHNWKGVTGGADGLSSIPRPFGIEDAKWFYWFCLAVLFLCILFVYRLKHSRLGRALFALREDELAASVAGVDLFKTKMLAFAICSTLGGIGGALYASGYGYISPDVFIFEQSVTFFAMLITGGADSIIGALVGTILLTWLPEWLRSFKEYYLAIYGGLIIVFLIFLPNGIWGVVSGLYGRLIKKKSRGGSPEKAGAIKFVEGKSLSYLEQANAATPIREDQVIFEVKGLKKHFGGVKAVDGVNFNVKKGDVHVLIGPNGSGKTTVINVLSGIYTATEGIVKYREKEITNHKPHLIVQMGAARTFQNIRLFPELSVIDNVMIGQHTRTKANLFHVMLNSRSAREEERKIRARAEEALAFVGFDNYFEKVKNLSYGQQRLVEIARALAAEPDLLFLDEPAAGMNPEETQELIKLIKRMNELGITMLLIEHDMQLVSQVADYITVLDFGKKISEGSVEQVLNDPEVIKAYLGEEFVRAET
ncbi:branched-chain amino acid ABC transporter ATP-binding protein/permease [Paenibacillus naphthalenovorans]|uniref:branched-chain amino acid ABC transporter ATP-binding protein/permease n=1 Tax=Paenibacillus naphthalenovorans TaxID=162209 RepID=UPI0008813666|nr:branched-chain amino acid ABC transporter ATP-binding protein/permease [Paenibacillus naphthalenovorans]SDI44512.1 branched-chain amino acid transport system permease protein [Paenibacillus naphthalenovorans]